MRPMPPASTPPAISSSLGRRGELVVTLEGDLTLDTIRSVWDDAIETVRESHAQTLTLDLVRVGRCDGAGLGLIYEMNRVIRAAGGTLSIRGAPDDLRSLLGAMLAGAPRRARHDPGRGNIVANIGAWAEDILREAGVLIAFVGELAAALAWALANPAKVRWRDTVVVAEKAGVNALPVLCLLGWLMGLIIAFQSAIPMQTYGTEGLIPQIIGIAMIRELGPLLTAILLAGRSGSAFAAELGTMRINEEISALSTFGIDPVRFLVIPRVLAALVMTPLLSLFATFMGIVGGYIVMASLGFSVRYYTDAIINSADAVDLLQGLFKTLVFALLVAAIGCLKGLRTGSGPGAVGDSTTRAVVAGIVLIIAADGILGVVFYYLGI